MSRRFDLRVFRAGGLLITAVHVVDGSVPLSPTVIHLGLQAGTVGGVVLAVLPMYPQLTGQPDDEKGGTIDDDD